MTTSTRRIARFLSLVLLAASFGACCFHGRGGGWGSGFCAPVRHCR